jgi:hypothetical protein
VRCGLIFTIAALDVRLTSLSSSLRVVAVAGSGFQAAGITFLFLSARLTIGFEDSSSSELTSNTDVLLISLGEDVALRDMGCLDVA